MKTVKYDGLTTGEALNLINKRQSFEVLGLSGRMSDAVSKLEQLIEGEGLSCRIYTYGRVAAAGGSLFGGVTGVLGIASAVGMAAHNLATYDPDYEVAKHNIDNKLTVTYKK